MIIIYNCKTFILQAAGNKDPGGQYNKPFSCLFPLPGVSMDSRVCTIKHYRSVIYGLHSKPGVFETKPVKVTDNIKDTSLLCNLSIFRTLLIRNVI